MKGHNGLDIKTFIGETVYHAGTYNGWLKHDRDKHGGIGVDVVSNELLFIPMPIPTELIRTAVAHEQDGKRGFLHHVKIRYWHLKNGIGHEGKQVTCGTAVGLAGNTGASSGPHLHWAPKWCDKDGNTIGRENGYTGAFDPTPFYNHNITAQYHAQTLQKEIVPLTEAEKKDISEQLSLLRTLLLVLQKLIYKL